MNLFSKKLKQSESVKLPINPIELYQVLPHKEGYAYPRGIQEEVLNAWHNRRTERDVIIKMGTGSGKTLVGLTMLYSKLAEGVGPCVYICPDNQLVDQVINQAFNYGIPVCQFLEKSSELPLDFLNSKSILVCNTHKMFHSYSAFRIRNIELGALVLDDAHKCIDIVRDQTSLILGRELKWVNELIHLFEDDLKFQSPANFIRLIDQDPFYQMRVPYWAWQEKHDSLIKIINEHSSIDEVKWKWELILNNLLSYDCFIGGDKIEISPLLVPIHEVPSFDQAKHRFILSATFEDEQDLIKDLGISYDSLICPIQPKDRKEIGQRLILAPSRIDPNISASSIKDLIASYANRGYNVVVITPSGNVAEKWVEFGAEIIENKINESINSLATSKGKFIVLKNRYDGIDLIGDMCRILVIDGLPKYISLRDHYLESRVEFLDASRKAQIIEQGLGRAARSGADYCTVFLMGNDLTRFLGIDKNLEFVTPITRAQLKLGLNLFDDGESDDSLKGISDVMNLCLNQNEDWRTFHTRAIFNSEPEQLSESKKKRLQFSQYERNAFLNFRKRKYLQASEDLNPILNDDTITPKQRAWYYQLAAQLCHLEDIVRSNDLQIKAATINGNMFHPAKEYIFAKIKNSSSSQAAIIKARINEFSRAQDLAFFIDEIISNLKFSQDIPSRNFEKALSDLGYLLGFKAQRPEIELGQGPDVLWCLSNNHYLILEAKSASIQELIPQKHVEQLLHSEVWFKNTYGDDFGYTLVTLQPSNRKMPKVAIHDKFKAINQSSLDTLKKNIEHFKKFLVARPLGELSESSIKTQVAMLELTPEAFLKMYLTKIN